MSIWFELFLWTVFGRQDLWTSVTGSLPMIFKYLELPSEGSGPFVWSWPLDTNMFTWSKKPNKAKNNRNNNSGLLLFLPHNNGSGGATEALDWPSAASQGLTSCLGGSETDRTLVPEPAGPRCRADGPPPPEPRRPRGESALTAWD